MKKLVLSIVIVAFIAIAAFGSASYVFAQTATPPTPGSGYGGGRMMGSGARGGMMGSSSADLDQDGPLHDAMIATYAEKLGLSVEDLNARLAAGETMAQIAAAKGLTTAQFQSLMTEARSSAIDQAVKAGTLTQAQADWMKQRGAGMMAGGGRGMRGSGQGRGSSTNCPYTQTTP